MKLEILGDFIQRPELQKLKKKNMLVWETIFFDFDYYLLFNKHGKIIISHR